MRVLLLVMTVAACKSAPKPTTAPACQKLVPDAVHDHFFRDAVLQPPDKAIQAVPNSVECTYSDGTTSLKVGVDCRYDDAAAVTTNLGKEVKVTDGTHVDGLGDGAFVSADKHLVEGHFGTNCDLVVSRYPDTAKIDVVAVANAVVSAYKP
jgi:hypothetical protein